MLIKHISKIDFEDEYISVDPNDTLSKIADEMTTCQNHSPKHIETIETPTLVAYVVDGGKPIGIIDPCLILKECVLGGKDPKKTKAKDVMLPPIVLKGEDEVRDALNLLIDKGMLTVAIVDEEEKLKGVISVYDAMFLKEELMLEKLETV